MFWLLTGPRESPPRGGAAWWERRAGIRGRRAAATDQTQALAAGAGGSNSKTSVAARPACVGGGREWGRVKGTDGPAGVLGLCIVLPADFNG